jgi:hypothetical protein
MENTVEARDMMTVMCVVVVVGLHTTLECVYRQHNFIPRLIAAVTPNCPLRGKIKSTPSALVFGAGGSN